MRLPLSSASWVNLIYNQTYKLDLNLSLIRLGVAHCFTGFEEDMEMCEENGFDYLSMLNQRQRHSDRLKSKIASKDEVHKIFQDNDTVSVSSSLLTTKTT